jgi:hypothetical protein
MSVPIIIATVQVRQSTRDATLWMKASVWARRNGALGKRFIGRCNITRLDAYGAGWDGIEMERVGWDYWAGPP